MTPMSDQTGGALKHCHICDGWMLAGDFPCHRCERQIVSDQPERDTPPDPWANVERWDVAEVRGEYRTEWKSRDGGDWMRSEDVDTARAQVEAQHAETVKGLTSCHCGRCHCGLSPEHTPVHSLGCCKPEHRALAVRQWQRDALEQQDAILEMSAELATLRAQLTEREQEIERLKARHANRHVELLEAMCAYRNIDAGHECKRCGGWGVYTYGSTSTWHGGIGGQALTMGVCDACWGSGNEQRPWPSHREITRLKGAQETP